MWKLNTLTRVEKQQQQKKPKITVLTSGGVVSPVNPFLFTTRVPRLSEAGHALLTAWGAGQFSALWHLYEQASVSSAQWRRATFLHCQ
jgi:hypothetical protein